MDFIDKIKQFSARINTMKDNISTEEATKTSMIMPFFQILGYDVFNPLEFVPEYTADFGIKKGEKVDYAIMGEDNQPLILIEAKWCGEPLDKHSSQLFRYFSTTPAKFGILTNGIIYRFYTDLDESNKMDDRPFLEFDILNIKEPLIPELKKFQKQAFDIEAITNSASELKYSSQIRQIFNEQLANPDDVFVKYILSKVYDGLKTQKVIDSFRPIVKKAFAQFVNEMINDRLKTALKTEGEKQIEDEQTDESISNELIEKSKIITTKEEVESFFIIKTLLHSSLEGHEITYKDTETYFSILIDNNTRKWICRLYLSEKRKFFVTPDKEKYQLDSIDGLYNYKDQLIKIAARYIKVNEESN
ncbi:hypothetical protein SELR_19550 [Selenomonas ruminantium subsp. lactilytica TAM6421]|uniref:Type I restriction enzyme R protein N-terminal domain-containing protein n=1 Tax=Selenomonas ruminantium subsp. lactilytica (strain NBRC 103574 / TAM6421) TaxID=927704 RepID=I0GSC6_SELRL|nr:type I restriction endonuclease [Selenomonas ruminantium]BAL83663.1 hypothetical protein SELR_19550 [Selenomonas ruminantium subsp. lactilytica TAM6421]